MNISELIKKREELNEKFSAGSMSDEQNYVHSNLELIQDALLRENVNSQPEYLKFVLETNGIINGKLEGTALIMPFFKQHDPQMKYLTLAVQAADQMLQTGASVFK